MPGEPEAIDEPMQQRLSARARRRDLQRLRDEWAPHRDAILRELEDFAGIGGITAKLRRDVGTVARSTHRIDRRLDELDQQIGL